MLTIKQGKSDNGVETIRRAARNYQALAFDFGPPVPIKPPHELLGEQLAEAKRFVAAHSVSA
ncbi:hypothetical protein [Rhodanobacter sp. T12-5]|uniref:hypothetical protein n=1 Tax=Rhodanobacter sp. T12-5 TaxID=2024611 RepID=UPI0011ECF4F7|nr:hypothetical protein [Rhodanobacter sp. T12-5]KAA0068395.1 hypothetical protein CIW53_15910 [Rhodanobacter sp. T12-5]